MNKRLQRIYNRLERDKDALLKQLAALSEEKLNARNKADDWSIKQIIVHVYEAEKFSLQYMWKKSLGMDALGNSGVRESLKSFLLTISQRLPYLKYKAPDAIAKPSADHASLEEITLQWNKGRGELKKFLESIEEKNIRKKIYKHPIAGYLNVMQGVNFLYEHLLHHFPQIKRLMR